MKIRVKIIRVKRELGVQQNTNSRSRVGSLTYWLLSNETHCKML